MRTPALAVICLITLPAAAQTVPPHPPITPPPTPPEVIAPKLESTAPNSSGMVIKPPNVDPEIARRPPADVQPNMPVIRPPNTQQGGTKP